MTRTRRNLVSSYVFACALALASPLVKSVVLALITTAMVVITFVVFRRAHTWPLIGLALVALGLALFAALITIDPVILATYLA